MRKLLYHPIDFNNTKEIDYNSPNIDSILDYSRLVISLIKNIDYSNPNIDSTLDSYLALANNNSISRTNRPLQILLLILIKSCFSDYNS